MGFYPRYFNEAVKNNSKVYNYDEWNMKSRCASGATCQDRYMFCSNRFRSSTAAREEECRCEACVVHSCWELTGQIAPDDAGEA